jgi:glycosyltransferase involved in cell wall biosynthesis
MMSTSVTVVLCTFNGSRFLAEQVTSILNQTYPIEELIISDDASTDSTPGLLEQLAKENSRIRIVLHQKNLGFSANFEQAMMLANSTLIAPADQDDIWHPEKIKQLVEAFAPTASIIYCDSVKFSNRLPLSPQPSKKNKRISGSDPRLLSVYNTVSGHAMLIRKNLLKTAFPMPAGVYYDWWLAVVGMAIDEVQFFPEILVYQRVHDMNVTLPSGVSKATQRHRFRATLVKHLKAFCSISQLSNEEIAFFNQAFTYWEASLRQRINFKLFFWLMQHRKIIYANKIRVFPLISQLKNSFVYSFRFRLQEGED